MLKDAFYSCMVYFTAVERDARFQTKLDKYVKGVPFINRRCTKGVSFLSKMVYKRGKDCIGPWGGASLCVTLQVEYILPRNQSGTCWRAGLDCEQSLFSQLSLSSAGHAGEDEMAERETGERPPFPPSPQLPLGFLFFAVSLASLDFLARVTIMRDC